MSVPYICPACRAALRTRPRAISYRPARNFTSLRKSQHERLGKLESRTTTVQTEQLGLGSLSSPGHRPSSQGNVPNKSRWKSTTSQNVANGYATATSTKSNTRLRYSGRELPKQPVAALTSAQSTSEPERDQITWTSNDFTPSRPRTRLEKVKGLFELLQQNGSDYPTYGSYVEEEEIDTLDDGDAGVGAENAHSVEEWEMKPADIESKMQNVEAEYGESQEPIEQSDPTFEEENLTLLSPGQSQDHEEAAVTIGHGVQKQSLMVKTSRSLLVANEYDAPILKSVRSVGNRETQVKVMQGQPELAKAHPAETDQPAMEQNIQPSLFQIFAEKDENKRFNTLWEIIQNMQATKSQSSNRVSNNKTVRSLLGKGCTTRTLEGRNPTTADLVALLYETGGITETEHIKGILFRLCDGMFEELYGNFDPLKASRALIDVFRIWQYLLTQFHKGSDAWGLDGLPGLLELTTNKSFLAGGYHEKFVLAFQWPWSLAETEKDIFGPALFTAHAFHKLKSSGHIGQGFAKEVQPFMDRLNVILMNTSSLARNMAGVENVEHFNQRAFRKLKKGPVITAEISETYKIARENANKVLKALKAKRPENVVPNVSRPSDDEVVLQPSTRDDLGSPPQPSDTVVDSQMGLTAAEEDNAQSPDSNVVILESSSPTQSQTTHSSQQESQHSSALADRDEAIVESLPDKEEHTIALSDVSSVTPKDNPAPTGPPPKDSFRKIGKGGTSDPKPLPATTGVRGNKKSRKQEASDHPSSPSQGKQQPTKARTLPTPPSSDQSSRLEDDSQSFEPRLAPAHTELGVITPEDHAEKHSMLFSYLRKAAKESDARHLTRLWKRHEEFYQDKSPKYIQMVYAEFMIAFVKTMQIELLLEVWATLRNKGIEPTVEHWIAMLRGCKVQRDSESLERIWTEMQRSGIQVTTAAWDAYISGLTACRDVAGVASAVRDFVEAWSSADVPDFETKEPTHSQHSSDLKSSPAPLHTAIAGLFKMGKAEVAHAVIEYSRNRGVQLTTETFNILLRRAVRRSNPEEVASVLADLRDSGCKADVITFTTLLDGVFRNSGSDFQEITAEEQAERLEQVFRDMEANDIMPTEQTYATMLSAMLQRSNPNPVAARALMQRMEKQGIKLTSHICTILVIHYFNCSPPDCKAAFSLWDHMKREKISPDHVFFDRMVENFAALGEFEHALQFLKSMPSYGKLPGWPALQATLGSFLKRGKNKQAVNFVRDVESGKEFVRLGIRRGYLGEEKWNKAVNWMKMRGMLSPQVKDTADGELLKVAESAGVGKDINNNRDLAEPHYFRKTNVGP